MKHCIFFKEVTKYFTAENLIAGSLLLKLPSLQTVWGTGVGRQKFLVNFNN